MEFDWKKDMELSEKMGWGKRTSNWKRYIAYLHEWANSHADEMCGGMSPVCYDEWYDNERLFEDDCTFCPKDEGEKKNERGTYQGD